MNCKTLKSLSSIPHGMCDVGLIENPSNPDEILIIGGYNDASIYIYNKIKDKFTKNKNGFNQIQVDSQSKSLRSLRNIAVVKGIKPHTIIVFGCFFQKFMKNSVWSSWLDKSKSVVGFIAVFNTKFMSFEDINNDKKYAIFDGIGCMPTTVRQITKLNDIFICTCRDDDNVELFRDTTFIDKGPIDNVNNNNNCNNINSKSPSDNNFDIVLNSLGSAWRCANPAAVIVVSNENELRQDKRKQNMTLVRFGGTRNHFIDSFGKVDLSLIYDNFGRVIDYKHSGGIDFNRGDCMYYRDRHGKYTMLKQDWTKNLKNVLSQIGQMAIDDGILTTKVQKYSHVGMNLYGRESKRNQYKYRGYDRSISMANENNANDNNGYGQSQSGVRDRYNYGLTLQDATFDEFSYHMFGGRFLIIIGGIFKDEENNRILSNHILFYDLVKKHWKLSKTRLPQRIYGHRSILHGINYNNNSNSINSSNMVDITIMGGCNDNVWDKNVCINWNLKLRVKMEWKIERLIWRAFYNDKKECLFAMIPRDVVMHIVSFLRDIL